MELSTASNFCNFIILVLRAKKYIKYRFYSVTWFSKEVYDFCCVTLRNTTFPLNATTVPIGYSNLGYSGRAAYSDLNPCDGPPLLHKYQPCL